MKKTIPGPVKYLMIFTGILLVIFLALSVFLPCKLSKWTHGVLCGSGVASINAEELESGNIRPVTEREAKSYSKFAKMHYKNAKRKLNSDQKETYQAVLAIPEIMIDMMNGTITPDQESLDQHVKKLLASSNLPELEMLHKNETDHPFLITAYASEAEEIAEEITRNLVMHNFAEALYLAAEYDMSTTFAAITAANAPYSEDTACLLGNLLKQTDDLYNALKMYEYALRIAPDNEAALIGAGNTCLDLGKIDQAERYFNRALSVSGGGGPANQGMMLVSFARKDDHSAFLYMIEGAKEGYTSILTDAYIYFRQKFETREAYLDFCGPILDQYGFKHLTDFTRTRLAFDPTLDTPGQMLTLDRTMALPNCGADVWNSCLISLGCGTFDHMAFLLKTLVGQEALNRFMNDGNIAALFTSEEAIAYAAENGISFSGMGDSLNTLAQSMKDENSSLTEMVTNLWDLAKTSKENIGYNPPASVGANGCNYDQEVFWMRILYDYTEYRFLELAEKYCDSLAQKYVYDNLDISYSNFDKELKKLEAKSDMEAIIHFFSCFISNGSPIATREYSLKEVERMGNRLVGFNPYLKKGYMECIMLAEEYWLYTNNILGYIADDAIYNRMVLTRNQLAARVTTYFPMMAGSYHGTIGITAPAWAGVTWSWIVNRTGEIHSVLEGLGNSDYVKYPAVPELPITDMGTKPKPPLAIKVICPSPKQLVEGLTGAGVSGEKGSTLTIKVEADDDSMVQVGSSEPETILAEDPDADQAQPPASTNTDDMQTTTDFTNESGLTIGFEFLGGSFGFNPDTLEFEVSIKTKVIGAKIAYNPTTDDITSYMYAGLDVGTGLLNYDKFSKLGIGGMNAKAVMFLSGTIRTSDLASSSVESGATVEAQAGNHGFGSTMAYNMISGVTRDTAHIMIGGQKVIQETTTETGSVSDAFGWWKNTIKSWFE